MANEQSAADPQRRKANKAVRNAVARGTMEKPDECERCDGRTPTHLLAGHHHSGYDKGQRLEVTWLCPSCHSKEHPEMQYGGRHRERTRRRRHLREYDVT